MANWQVPAFTMLTNWQFGACGKIGNMQACGKFGNFRFVAK
jgi:hypothetical protein